MKKLLLTIISCAVTLLLSYAGHAGDSAHGMLLICPPGGECMTLQQAGLQTTQDVDAEPVHLAEGDQARGR